jgi:hypothetical protein
MIVGAARVHAIKRPLNVRADGSEVIRCYQEYSNPLQKNESDVPHWNLFCRS